MQVCHSKVKQTKLNTRKTKENNPKNKTKAIQKIYTKNKQSKKKKENRLFINTDKHNYLVIEG